MVIRDGIIVGVGNVSVPADARVWNLEGRVIYPGLIASSSSYGMPKRSHLDQTAKVKGGASEEARGPLSWNSNVLTHMSGADLFVPDPAEAERLRQSGVTSAVVVPTEGIFRGTSALVSVGTGTANDQIILSRLAHHVSLRTSGEEVYPRSLMGTIALIRQTLYDARWYQRAVDAYSRVSSLHRPEANRSLAALGDVVTGQLPLVIEASDEKNLLRADAIGKEFSLQLIIQGSGYEYRRLEAVQAAGRSLMIPVDFPAAPSVSSPEQALQVSLVTLRHWDEAPENPLRLAEAGVDFALISAGRPDSLLQRVRCAVERGLAPVEALRALTTTPARLLGADHLVGTLEAGKLAHFIVAGGNLFSRSTNIYETWVDGIRYEVKRLPEGDLRGRWQVVTQGKEVDSLIMDIGGRPDSLRGSIIGDESVLLKGLRLSASSLEFMFPGTPLGIEGVVRMSGALHDDHLTGIGEWPDGTTFSWSAVRLSRHLSQPVAEPPKPPVRASFPPAYPPGAYGRTSLPKQPPVVLVQNATIWTCGPEGVLQGADLLIQTGKVARVGKNLDVPSGAFIIDASGKHVTPGLIDAHSHMAISGSVNEPMQAISAEVRVGDLVDCDDISVYRALAGGLTVAHLLHGSANPIGGQSQVIKLRWGMLPEEMKFRSAAPTIKFALGENVKQSNWGESYTTRYPQTRMGVVQILRDAFRAARDYERSWNAFQKNGIGIPPRRDLELDALLEILRGNRLIHCHSYRQDEILATMRVAEEFGFTVGTFQHILEGYKVADAMAKHGAAASSFSDWWAYKLEVYDAIPYNGALMHEQGVLVSFNSDSDELARRLNLEAAKAVKYGGLTEEEALAFVTINPAKQLRIEDRVGSIQPGIDADFVLWTGNPLSTYTVCEQTWIDGRKFFDREEDRRMQTEVQHQRATLIQKILHADEAPSVPAGTDPPADQPQPEHQRKSRQEARP
jgi:N-acetylglucosamine-6-phosphate deacetylase